MWREMDYHWWENRLGSNFSANLIQTRKSKGYRWPGIVVSVYRSCHDATKISIVVECTISEVLGAQHIFSPNQLEVWNN
jgi:hypothetical protein